MQRIVPIGSSGYVPAFTHAVKNLPFEQIEKLKDFLTEEIVNEKGFNGMTVLFLASSKMSEDKPELLNFLLNMGADATVLSDEGETVLHLFNWYPSDYDFTIELDRIIGQGIETNSQDARGETPFFSVLVPNGYEANTVAYFKYLISKGWDPTIANNGGQPPTSELYYLQYYLAGNESTEELYQVLKALLTGNE